LARLGLDKIRHLFCRILLTANDRPDGATHVRRSGATLKWQNWGSRRASKLAFLTPFRNNIFYGFSAA